MISGKLKKLAAEELGFKVESGIAYGKHDGYLLTLQEENNMIVLTVSASFDSDLTRDSVAEAIKDSEVRKLYRANLLRIDDMSVAIQFPAGGGGIKRLRAFLADWLPGKLNTLGAKGADTCPICKQHLEEGQDALFKLEGTAHRVHEACISQMESQHEEIRQELQVQPKNTGLGLIGAIIGGIVGAIPLVIVSMLGYWASFCGLFVGLATKFGYEKLGGKPSKMKILIVSIVTLVCVVLGCVVSYEAAVVGIFMDEYGLALSDFNYVTLFFNIILTPEVWTDMIGDLLINLVFAAIGIGGMFKDMNRERKGIQVEMQRLVG